MVNNPRVGDHIIKGSTVFGGIALTTSQANAEQLDKQNTYPAYERYFIDYMTRMAKAKEYHPYYNVFEHTKPFEVWYQEN